MGFGISNEDHAREVVKCADGVIIGSALIRIVQASPSGDEAVAGVREFLHGINKAINLSAGS